MLITTFKNKYNKIKTEYQKNQYEQDTVARKLEEVTAQQTDLNGKIDAKKNDRSEVQQNIDNLKTALAKVPSDDAETKRQIQEQLDAEKLSLNDMDNEIEKLNNSQIKDSETYQKLVQHQTEYENKKEKLENELESLKQEVDSYKDQLTKDDINEVQSWFLAG